MAETAIMKSWANRSQFGNIFTLVAVGDREGVKEAVGKENGALKATEEEAGAGPLHWAVKHDREELVRILVDLGADMEAVDADSETPLLYACREGRAGMVGLLADQCGADLAAVGLGGQTGLHRVAARGRGAAMETLIRLGAGLDARDAGGSTPLHLACARAGGRRKE